MTISTRDCNDRYPLCYTNHEHGMAERGPYGKHILDGYGRYSDILAIVLQGVSILGTDSCRFEICGRGMHKGLA